MMALSLMSSLQILAHQSPTVRKFWRIETLSFDHGFTSYFWKARISLKSVHWPKMRLVDANNSLCWCLCLPVAGKYISLSDCHCLFYSLCKLHSLHLSFLYLLRSHHKLGWDSWLVLQTCCALRLKLCLRLNKKFTQYIFRCSILLFEFRIENEFLHWGCELPDVPPHDRAVCAGSEEL